MKSSKVPLLAVFCFLLACATSAFAEWEVTKVESQIKKEQTGIPEDFWLVITLTNQSDATVYLQGIRPGWYMVESYIKDPQGDGWTRQNIGLDQTLEMLPIAPRESIRVTHRESKAHVGRDMMLTFMTAASALDLQGSRILVGAFKVPEPK
jgi:hypothetical protein